MVDLDQNLAFVPLLTNEVKTLTPLRAIFDALAHLTFALAWEKWVVLDQI
jgi:hypothetical protein